MGGLSCLLNYQWRIVICNVTESKANTNIYEYILKDYQTHFSLLNQCDPQHKRKRLLSKAQETPLRSFTLKQNIKNRDITVIVPHVQIVLSWYISFKSYEFQFTSSEFQWTNSRNVCENFDRSAISSWQQSMSVHTYLFISLPVF